MSSTHSETATSGTPRRSDALRNRERILSVAYRAFKDREGSNKPILGLTRHDSDDDPATS